MGTQILQVLEKPESFDGMLGQVKETICEKDPSLEFYTTQIQPIIQCRWDRMNTPLHLICTKQGNRDEFPKWGCIGNVTPQNFGNEKTQYIYIYKQEHLKNECEF